MESKTMLGRNSKSAYVKALTVLVVLGLGAGVAAQPAMAAKAYTSTSTAAAVNGPDPIEYGGEPLPLVEEEKKRKGERLPLVEEDPKDQPGVRCLACDPNQ